jgi:hypothetical protein
MSDVVKKKSADIADEAETILPESDGSVELIDGFRVTVNRLRLREFLALMKVVTRGASPLMASIQLDSAADTSEFAKNFLGLLMFAIPEAEDEIIDFVRMIVVPQAGSNPDTLLAIDAAMSNPDLEDVVIILEKLVEQEASSVQSLGKRLASLFNLAQRLGQV